MVHTISMIYFGSFFAGIINGLFGSGAGQILVFILIFLLKSDTYKSRTTSILVMGAVTIVTIIRHLTNIDLKISKIIIVVIVGLLFGVLGQKIMKKIPAGYLNIISGLLVLGLSLFSLLRG